jgi:cephalosporin hydroxylase
MSGGVDVEIRAYNRRAIESHELSSMIKLIEGDSASPGVVQEVRRRSAPGNRCS